MSCGKVPMEEKAPDKPSMHLCELENACVVIFTKNVIVYWGAGISMFSRYVWLEHQTW